MVTAMLSAPFDCADTALGSCARTVNSRLVPNCWISAPWTPASSIVDSNVSTALTAAVLYQYGTGPVRGFAVTLLAGIAASMITSIFVVRTFYMLWLDRSRDAQQSLSI